ncbi:MAG: hypothetical protein K8R69_06010 [Deltaproteobacteria bacterium]|nr:hypothetical protein [Deltaproteobacteria bacterium]
MGHISASRWISGIPVPSSWVTPHSQSLNFNLSNLPRFSLASSRATTSLFFTPGNLRLFQAGTAASLLKTIAVLQPAFAGLSAVDRVLDALRFIDKRVKTTVYNHNTVVNPDKGQFEFDCSGMVNWILQRAAPDAYAELKSDRPRVAEYVKALRAVPYDKPSNGWRRVKKIADAEPGDIIAWPTPDWYPSDATGHMGVLAAKPEAVSGGYLLRLADATGYPHGEDTREGGTGFGYGTILVTLNPDTGEGTGQGWTGRYSGNTVIKTPIYVGRPLK